MAVLSARELTDIANDVNTRRINELSEFLYDAILAAAMNGEYTYKQTFESLSNPAIERLIIHVRDMFEGIEITRLLEEHKTLVFCWEDVDDEMPSLISLGTKNYLDHE